MTSFVDTDSSTSSERDRDDSSKVTTFTRNPDLEKAALEIGRTLNHPVFSRPESIRATTLKRVGEFVRDNGGYAGSSSSGSGGLTDPSHSSASASAPSAQDKPPSPTYSYGRSMSPPRFAYNLSAPPARHYSTYAQRFYNSPSSKESSPSPSSASTGYDTPPHFQRSPSPPRDLSSYHAQHQQQQRHYDFGSPSGATATATATPHFPPMASPHSMLPTSAGILLPNSDLVREIDDKCGQIRAVRESLQLLRTADKERSQDSVLDDYFTADERRDIEEHRPSPREASLNVYRALLQAYNVRNRRVQQYLEQNSLPGDKLNKLTDKQKQMFDLINRVKALLLY